MSVGEEGPDPYVPPKAHSSALEAAPSRLRSASLSARCFAAAIDSLLIASLTTVPLLVLAKREAETTSPLEPRTVLAWTVLGTLAYALVQSLALVTRSASVGKLWAGLEVRRPDGRPASRAQLLVFRPVFPFLAFVAALVDQVLPLHVRELGIGLDSCVVAVMNGVNVLTALENDRRCLHDHFAGTVVLARKSVLRTDPSPA